ncbi:MAG: hypothetical protein D4R67_12310 [Bacteroidetes bacterium]|nr:MAG: hypothetical protein D4R67_12310 [Bacteroidota bacterium]
MPSHAPKPEIQIIAYVSVNDARYQSDNDNQTSRYVRSFRYEHFDDPLVSRRMAFNKLLDERQTRLFGNDINHEQQLRGLSLYMKYQAPFENGKEKTHELKKLYLLTGKPMSTQDQLKRWH